MTIGVILPKELICIPWSK